jgi:hypothetical protein
MVLQPLRVIWHHHHYDQLVGTPHPNPRECKVSTTLLASKGSNKEFHSQELEEEIV